MSTRTIVHPMIFLLTIILPNLLLFVHSKCLHGYYRTIYMKEFETKPNDYNQMFVWFGSSTAKFYIVDLEPKSDIYKDVIVNFQTSSYDLLQNETILEFNSQASLTCQVNIGIFSPTSQSVMSNGCLKWVYYVRGYSYSFSEHDNCTRVSLQSDKLSMVLEKSEISYPYRDFEYDFLTSDKGNWYISNPESNLELFVKFGNASEVEGTYNRHDLLTAHYEMIIQSKECQGAAQIKGKIEIFTTFSIISSNIESCLESAHSKCKLCNSKYVQLLQGQLNANGSEFSILNYPIFKENGQSPQPFHPIVAVSSPLPLSSLLAEEENLAIIICASIGGALLMLAVSFIVVGLVYVSRRRMNNMRPAYVPLK